MADRDTLQHQIEQLLDEKAKNTGEKEQFSAIDSIKEIIVTQINDVNCANDFEKFTLKDKDLKEVYESLLKSENRRRTLEKCGVLTFRDFLDLSGSELLNKKTTVLFGLQVVHLFGKMFHLHLPFGLDETQNRNLRTSLGKIGKRHDLAPYFHDKTILEADGAVHVSFVIEKEGKKIKYIATPEDLLRVESEPAEDEIRSIKEYQTAKKLQDLVLDNLLFQAESWNEKQKEAFQPFKTLTQENLKKQAATDLEIFPADMRENLQALRRANKIIWDAETKGQPGQTGETVLVDDDPGLEEAERVSHLEIMNYATGFFERHYRGKSGKEIRTVAYRPYWKEREKTFDEETGKQNSEVEYFNNGKIRSQKKFNHDGNEASHTLYRKDGTVNGIADPEKTVLCDKKGKSLSITYKKNPNKICVINENGESVSDFATYLEQHGISPQDIERNIREIEKWALGQGIRLRPSIADKLKIYNAKIYPRILAIQQEYIETIKRVLNTPERYNHFEKLYLDVYKPSESIDDEIIKQIREHGMELLGLKDEMRSILERIRVEQGIDIEINTGWIQFDRINFYTKFVPLREIVPFLKETERLLKQYPRSFIRNTGINKIFLVTGFTGRNEDKASPQYGHDICPAGLSLGKTVFIRRGKGLLQHEFQHSADHRLNYPLDEWARTAHGDNYKTAYGGENAMDSIMGKHDESRPPGFAYAYGKYGGIKEDKATVAEILLTEYNTIMSWAEKEPPLAAKIRMTKELYFKMSDGKMDAKFWEDLSKGAKIDEDYWRRREEAQDYVRQES
jgi:hypothetical protein